MVEVPPMKADRQKHRTAGTAGIHVSPKTRRTTGSAPAKSSAAAGYRTAVTRFSARAVASANRAVSAWRLESAGNRTRPATLTTCSGRKARAEAQFRNPTPATPLHAVTNVGTTASPAIPTRTLLWNRTPNFNTGASSRQLQRNVGRHRAAVQSTSRLIARAASAPATKLQSPAPASAAPTATAQQVTVSAVSA